jgi:two-component system, chemotaxis family, CheB/CheR fusion protein
MDESPSNPESGNDTAMAAGRHDFLIVGIGASAGGVQALKEFFEQISADSGVAYVVILHLSPDHDSHLAEVLQTVTQIPVEQVREKTRLEPNHVYVVPPNQHLAMRDGFVDVSPNMSLEERRAPVDIFFRTLAESHQVRAVAAILSGSGANGSMGLKRIKEKGGVAFVQNPREAEFSEMPRNAIATGLVDAILNVREIPAKIIAYKENLKKVEIPMSPEFRPDDERAAMREILAVLRVQTGHDFSNYKRATVARRIQRRIHVCELATLSAYAAHLRNNPDEAQLLLKDLLISVTNFFRDQAAFDFLGRVILPRLTQNKSASDPIRVWVAGCATGEEAYSMAMLLVEQAEGAASAPAIQVFATDIDEAAIAMAREGFYTPNDAADVSPVRLRRFFTKDGDNFRVRRELREMVLFAKHNLLKDPPFSHLDLVTCRNLLIYFNAAAQERAMETFHFALNPGGYLFLGTSESVDGASDLYAPVNKEHHIYQSRQAAARIAYPLPDAPTVRQFAEPKLPAVAGGMSQEQEHRLLERISFGDLHQQLLEQYASPSVVINENYDIVHLSDGAGRFLQIAGGEPSKNLLHLIHPDLRLELRTALFQAIQRRANVEATNLKFPVGGQVETINIHVRPVLRPEDTARGFLLVLFEKTQEESAAAPERVVVSDEPIARRLEEELERIKGQLRSSVEQYEVQAEELRASNEELQALNEELRSSAEELETSREELQSVNEELLTVNQELKIKIEELSQSNNDFQNLMNSTDIGTIFLDRALRIKMFTPSVREIFNLIDADLNRPLADITTKLNFADLHADLEKVLDTLQTVEREIEAKNGKWYLMKIFPYRTSEDRISGVVVTFIAITRRRLSELAANEAAERLRLILESVKDFAIITTDAAGMIAGWNPGAEKIFGWAAREIIGQSSDMIFTPEDRERGVPDQERKKARKEGRAADERWHMRKDGARFFVSGVMSPVRDSGKLTGYVKVARDLTEQRQAAEALRRAHEELEERVRERTRELAEANGLLQAEIAERKAAEAARTRLVRQLMTSQEDERHRIAREVHDQFGQLLTSMILKLGILKTGCGEQKEQCEQIEALEVIARQLDADVDFIAWQLRPTALDDLGLQLALTDYAQNWSKHFGIPIELHTSGAGKSRLPIEIETALYRIAQEALNNVAKHADASGVNLLLERRKESISLIIEDDGKGFDEEKLYGDGGRQLGIGGMRERALLLGGTIEIESQPGKGATVIVHIPAPPASPQANIRGEKDDK